MPQFEFLSVALSFVLGLAVTVLLSSLLMAFRARRTTRMSWLPLAWAILILLIQFETWWEVYGLVVIQSWSVAAFMVLLMLVLTLFAAGGLILPTGLGDYPDDLYQYFQEDGRWAVLVVALFEVTAIVANIFLFNFGVFILMNAWNLLGIAITLVVFFSKRRSVQNTATLIYIAWLAAYLWMFLPLSYEA